MPIKKKAPRNRTIPLADEELVCYRQRLLKADCPIADVIDIRDRTVNQTMEQVLPLLPSSFVDLLFLDPPYNLTKTFGQAASFRQMPIKDYAAWLESWLAGLVRLLKPTATVYICADFYSSAAVHLVAEKYFRVRSRITWEREKGRGAKKN